jgi:hypothetical protein
MMQYLQSSKGKYNKLLDGDGEREGIVVFCFCFCFSPCRLRGWWGFYDQQCELFLWLYFQ